MSIPQCIVLEIPDTLRQLVWLRISGNSSERLHCGNAVHSDLWLILEISSKTINCDNYLQESFSLSKQPNVNAVSIDYEFTGHVPDPIILIIINIR